MIIGDQFSILKGYIVFDPQIQTGDNPYVYLTLREKTYKDRQSGKQNYQQVKVLIQGPAVESVVRPRIKKNSFAEFYGRFVIKYATNDAGYEDLNKVESVLFRVEQIGRIEEPRPQNENNQGQQNSQGNSNNNNGGNGNYNNGGNGNYNNGGNGNYNNGGNGNYNNGGNGNYNNGGNGNYNNGGNGNYNNGGNGNYNNNGGGGYQNNNQDPFGGGGGFGGQGNYSQNNQDPFSGDGRPIDISDDDLPF